jgi:3-hydroxybutyryl-CoA dehydrogenase
MRIRKVAVIGAGVMGSGITQVVANAGFKVALRSRKGEEGLNRLRDGIRKAVRKEILTDEQAALVLSNINCTSSLSKAVKEADLIIEAVVEDLTIKREIFGAMDASCMQHTILASNTSSLSIARLAEATKRPDKVLGMHFFNPAPAMKLIEVVQAPMTSKETVDSIIEFSNKIGKFPLIVRDSPGFIVNKILMPMINAAAFVLMDKIATAETIDSAMKLGANHPLGPLALADLIGIDVCVNIMKELQCKLEGQPYTVCPLLEEMVTKGILGRKTGKGFFTYET